MRTKCSAFFLWRRVGLSPQYLISSFTAFSGFFRTFSWFIFRHGFLENSYSDNYINFTVKMEETYAQLFWEKVFYLHSFSISLRALCNLICWAHWYLKRRFVISVKSFRSSFLEMKLVRIKSWAWSYGIYPATSLVSFPLSNFFSSFSHSGVFSVIYFLFMVC